jgi:hypothetical protein
MARPGFDLATSCDSRSNCEYERRHPYCVQHELSASSQPYQRRVGSGRRQNGAVKYARYLSLLVSHDPFSSPLALPPGREALLPLCMTRASTRRMRAICTPVTPLCPPMSRRTGTSAGPSCGTFVPCAISRRHALWPSLGGHFLLVPTGN